jgi:hypothetical protein
MTSHPKNKPSYKCKTECFWSVAWNESQLSYLLPLKFRSDIILNCVETISDVEPETHLIKNTLVLPREKCAASSWVNNDYTDTRRGGAGLWPQLNYSKPPGRWTNRQHCTIHSLYLLHSSLATGRANTVCRRRAPCWFAVSFLVTEWPSSKAPHFWQQPCIVKIIIIIIVVTITLLLVNWTETNCNHHHHCYCY